MKRFKLFEQIKNEKIFDKIRNEYFKSPVIDFSYTQTQGYRATSNKIIFGTKMTTEADIEYLLHEMGHFVLFKDYNRLLKSEYGLNYPQIEINGQMYDQASSWTDIKNETRAVVFQYILAKKYGILLDLDGWIDSLRLLNGFTFVPVDGAEQKDDYVWYETDGKKVSYDTQEKRKLITIRKFFDEEIKKERYNIDYFNTEWFNRVKFLEEKLTNSENNIYGYWDLSNALDSTELLKMLKDFNIEFKYDSSANKLIINVDNDVFLHRELLAELKKIKSFKEDNLDTENDVIEIKKLTK